MKILAWTPTHPEYGIKPQTWASIQAALTAYSGPIHWVLSHGDNPYRIEGDEADRRARGYLNVTHQHNTAREMALSGDYDALLSIEADMVIPADTVARLVALEADVAYGLYAWRAPALLERWSAWTTCTLWGGKSAKPEQFGGAIDVKGVGMGVTLISRRVLEALSFRLYEGEQGDWLIDEVKRVNRELGCDIDPYRERRGMFCDDYMLALDAQQYGFTQRADLGLVCGHVNGETVLWPDPQADGLVRVESI